MLHWNRYSRLGSYNGVLEVINHHYLQDMDITSIGRKTYKAPYIPDGEFVHCDIKATDAQEAIRHHCMASPVAQQHLFEHFKINNYIGSHDEKCHSLSPLTISTTQQQPSNEISRIRRGAVESSSSLILSNNSK